MDAPGAASGGTRPADAASPIRFWATAAALFTSTALLATYPVALELGKRLPGDGGDGYLHAWNVWYVHRALTRADTHLFDTNLLFYPVGTPLHFHSLSPGTGLIGAPLIGLGVSVGTTYGLLWLFTFVSSGLTAAFLAMRATGERAGALVAGLGFMLCPYRTAHGLGHLELLGTEWIPLTAGLMLMAFPVETTPHRRTSARLLLPVLAALSFAMTSITSWYYMIDLVLLLLPYAALLAWKGRWRDHLAGGACFGLAAAVLLYPFAKPVVRDLASGKSYFFMDTAAELRADLAGFFLPSFLSTVWSWLNHAMAGDAKVYRGFPAGGTVWLGYASLILAVFGVRKAARFWTFATAVFLVLSLGPSLSAFGKDLPVPLPGALMSHVPILRAARAPDRLILMASMSMVPLVAAGAGALLRRSRKPRLALLALLAAVALDLSVAPYPSTDAAIPAPFQQMAQDPAPGAVLLLERRAVMRAMYLMTASGRPLCDGLVARADPDFQGRFEKELKDTISILTTGGASAGTAFRERLRAMGVRYVVLRLPQVPGPPGVRYLGIPFSDPVRAVALRTLKDAFPAGPLCDDETTTVYRLETSR